MRDGEFSFLAAALVYQYIASLDTMERTAAASATRPGMGKASAPPRMFPHSGPADSKPCHGQHRGKQDGSHTFKPLVAKGVLPVRLLSRQLDTGNHHKSAQHIGCGMDSVRHHCPGMGHQSAASFRMVSTTLPRIVTTETRIALASPLFDPYCYLPFGTYCCGIHLFSLFQGVHKDTHGTYFFVPQMPHHLLPPQRPGSLTACSVWGAPPQPCSHPQSMPSSSLWSLHPLSKKSSHFSYGTGLSICVKIKLSPKGDSLHLFFPYQRTGRQLYGQQFCLFYRFQAPPPPVWRCARWCCCSALAVRHLFCWAAAPSPYPSSNRLAAKILPVRLHLSEPPLTGRLPMIPMFGI